MFDEERALLIYRSFILLDNIQNNPPGSTYLSHSQLLEPNTPTQHTSDWQESQIEKHCLAKSTEFFTVEDTILVKKRVARSISLDEGFIGYIS